MGPSLHLRLLGVASLACLALGACTSTNNTDAGNFSELPRIPRDGNPSYWDVQPDAVSPDATLPDATMDDAGEGGTMVAEGGEVGPDVPADVPPVATQVRLGNVLAGGAVLPPAIDFCVRPAGASTMTFTGPLLETRGRAAGLAWNEIGTYFSYNTGHYDLMLVSATATDCASPLATVPNVDFGSTAGFRTVLVDGVLAAPDAGAAGPYAPRAVSLVDRDPANAPTADPQLRVVMSLPVATRFDLGIVAFGSLNVLFQNVGFSELAGPSPDVASVFDANRYYNGTPASGITVGLGPTGTGMVSQMISNLTVPQHGFLLAVVTTVSHGSGAPSPGVLLCTDSGPYAMGLTPCVVPP